MVCSILFNIFPQLVVLCYYTYYCIFIFLVCQFFYGESGSVYEVIVEFNAYAIVFGGNKTKLGGSKYNAQ